MEANEVPERIYLPEEPFKYGDSEKCWNYKPLGGIEYVRTDAIIQKAVTFIKERLNFADNAWYIEGEITVKDKVIEDFQNSMKGE